MEAQEDAAVGVAEGPRKGMYCVDARRGCDADGEAAMRACCLQTCGAENT